MPRKRVFLFPCLKILLGHSSRWTSCNNHEPSCGVLSSWEGRDIHTVTSLLFHPLRFHQSAWVLLWRVLDIYGPKCYLMHLTYRCRFLSCSVRMGGGGGNKRVGCFWAQMALATLVAISGPKKGKISGPTASNTPRYGLLPHPNPYAPPHINNRYINS